MVASSLLEAYSNATLGFAVNITAFSPPDGHNGHKHFAVLDLIDQSISDAL